LGNAKKYLAERRNAAVAKEQRIAIKPFEALSATHAGCAYFAFESSLSACRIESLSGKSAGRSRHAAAASFSL
jgi:hypothetical protein